MHANKLIITHPDQPELLDHAACHAPAAHTARRVTPRYHTASHDRMASRSVARCSHDFAETSPKINYMQTKANYAYT